MSLLDKFRKKNEKNTKEENKGNQGGVFDYKKFEECSNLSDYQAQVVFEEAQKIKAKLEDKNYVQEMVMGEFKDFMEKVAQEQSAEEGLAQETLETPDLDDPEVLAQMMEMHPPKEDSRQKEQIRRYKVLCEKGFINEDVKRNLILPYLLEKRGNGQVLTKDEQEQLDGIYATETDIGKAYTKAVLMLQTIGLVDYEKDFPKTKINALLVLSVDYGLYPPEIMSGFMNALEAECSNGDNINTVDIDYRVEAAIQEFKSNPTREERTPILPMIRTGLKKGIVAEDIIYMPEEVKDSKQVEGGRE